MAQLLTQAQGLTFLAQVLDLEEIPSALHSLTLYCEARPLTTSQGATSVKHLELFLSVLRCVQCTGARFDQP